MSHDGPARQELRSASRCSRAQQARNGKKQPMMMIAMEMIFDLEKRSIVRLNLSHAGAATRPVSLLDRLALGADLGDHGAHDLDADAVGDLDLDSAVVVDDLGHLADDAARGDHGVAAADVLDHLLVRLHPLLLRPDDEEPHDDEDQDERDELQNHVAAPGGGPLARRRA